MAVDEVKIGKKTIEGGVARYEKESWGNGPTFGTIYKDSDDYMNHPDEICYIPEHAEPDEGYTANDFLTMCNNQKEIADQLFNEVSWTHPSTLLDEWEKDGTLNTKLSYLYRDASNYKKFTEVVVEGVLDAGQITAIQNKCDDEEHYFIPEQVGLPANRFEESTEDDHPFCELIEIEWCVDEEPTVAISADELARRFESVKYWGVCGEPEIDIIKSEPIKDAPEKRESLLGRLSEKKSLVASPSGERAHNKEQRL